MTRLILLTALFLSAVLSSCVGRGNSLAPIITIYDPPSGAIRRVDKLEVRGYAMDDEGIVSILVNNTDLLASNTFATEKGKKLIQFGFRASPTGDQFSSTIVAIDKDGNSTTLNYTLDIDTTPPSLELDTTAIGNNRWRVSGIARDNDVVKSIVVAGQALSFVETSEKEFTLDIDASETMDVVVEDRAGNRTSEAIVP